MASSQNTFTILNINYNEKENTIHRHGRGNR